MQSSFDDCWRADVSGTADREAYCVAFPDGRRLHFGADAPAFELAFRTPSDHRAFLEADLYSCAKAFVNGRFDIFGDPIAAVAFKLAHPGGRLRRWRGAVLASLLSLRPESWLQSRTRARRNIEFHYDRAQEFYSAFLDSRMVYSCAYFRHAGMCLDDAQEAKLDLICRKLDIHGGERFLDIGCGWGALLLHATQHYGALSTGCTLSASQADYAAALSRSFDLDYEIDVKKVDFRDLDGQYGKIASVGMFEHVGSRRLHRYFSKVHALLAADGRFLHHGIVRPEGVHNGPETRFLRKYVFPGGELVHLSDVIRIAGNSGLEVLDIENLRPHYAMTCRRWVERLIENEERCVKVAGVRTYRTWLLYLSASALSFERGQTDVYQVLIAKRSGPARRLTRDYMCRRGQQPGR
jgi:cyclopropane-fatty-acyl-phospholipid synthase